MALHGILMRSLAALPDAITAALFIAAWRDPQWVGLGYVENLFGVMTLEFFVVHSSIFYVVITAMPGTWRLRRRQAFGALALLYLLIVSVFALGNRSPWMIWAFLWLWISRFLHLWTVVPEGEETIRRNVKLWAISVGAYIGIAMAVLALPLPALGITPDLFASLPVRGSFKPQQMLAWGCLYFLIQAWSKFAICRPARKHEAAPVE